MWRLIGGRRQESGLLRLHPEGILCYLLRNDEGASFTFDCSDGLCRGL